MVDKWPTKPVPEARTARHPPRMRGRGFGAKMSSFNTPPHTMPLPASTLDALRSFPAQLGQFFAAIPTGRRNWEPASWQGIPGESFSPLGQICHVRDIEIDGYQVRLRRLLEEDAPRLVSLDGYELARERRYAEADPQEALAAFSAARAQTLRLLETVPDGSLGRTGHFEGYGQVTLQGVVHYLCSHDQLHLAGMQWLHGKMLAE